MNRQKILQPIINMNTFWVRNQSLCLFHLLSCEEISYAEYSILSIVLRDHDDIRCNRESSHHLYRVESSVGDWRKSEYGYPNSFLDRRIEYSGSFGYGCCLFHYRIRVKLILLHCIDHFARRQWQCTFFLSCRQSRQR